MPEDFAFDVTRPFELQLLVRRAFGSCDKAGATFALDCAPPQSSLPPEPPPVAKAATVPATSNLFAGEENPLRVNVRQMNRGSIAVTMAAIAVLTLIVFGTGWCAARASVPGSDAAPVSSRRSGSAGTPTRSFRSSMS